MGIKIVILKLKPSEGSTRKFKVKRIYTKDGIDSIPFDEYEAGDKYCKFIKLPGVGCKIRKDDNEAMSDHCQYIYGGIIPETCGGEINKRVHYYWFPEADIFTEFDGDPESSFSGSQQIIDGVTYRAPRSKKYYISKKSPICNDDFKFIVLENKEAQIMLLLQQEEKTKK